VTNTSVTVLLQPECVSGVTILYKAKGVESQYKINPTLYVRVVYVQISMSSMTIALSVSVCFRILTLRVTEKLDF
jgi:hypothetical protein